ncbi:hypothetical protein, partial [Ideonella sp.]|uniref:hypothetical protein n=1 Tax=Ideonella sp. TaxID=1929293 RepID=UPI003BB651AC
MMRRLGVCLRSSLAALCLAALAGTLQAQTPLAAVPLPVSFGPMTGAADQSALNQPLRPADRMA